MKKLTAVVLTGLMVAMCLVGCSKKEASSGEAAAVAAPAPAPVKKKTIKFASIQASTSLIAVNLQATINEINSKTKGVEIQFFPGGVLGVSRDQVEGAHTGMIDIVLEGPAQFAMLVPLASMLEAPYIYNDFNHIKKALAGEFGKKVEEGFQKQNMHLVNTFYYGCRQLSTTKKPVQTLADFEGLKIRVPEVDTYLDMVRSWGAKPTPLNFNELFLALQQNVVDGQENPLTTFESAKFQDVQKYITLTNHIVCTQAIVANKAAWDSIPADDRKIVEDGLQAGCDKITKAIEDQEKSLIATFEKAGVTVLKPDVTPFREATLKVIEKNYADKWGRDNYNAVINIK